MAEKKEILRVKGKVKQTYAKLSRIYSTIEGTFEKKIREKGVKLLDIQEGERVLEIGFGTGYSLAKMARSVGENGKVYGIDVTPEMIELAQERVEKEGLAGRVELSEGDARDMPYQDNMFDAVYMAEVLELFDTPDIPRVLKESRRVLKPDGRLAVASMSKEGYEDSKVLRFYEWMHKTFPKYASCRPIYVEDSVKEAGYKVVKTDEVLLGKIFPMKIVLAKPSFPG